MKYQKCPIFPYFWGFLSFFGIGAGFGPLWPFFWSESGPKCPENDPKTINSPTVKCGTFWVLAPRAQSHVVGYELPNRSGDRSDEFRPWSCYGHYVKIARSGK